MNGEIIHVEFPSADFEKSSAFYQALFGWLPDSEQAGGHLGLRVPGSAQSSWVRSALAYASAPVIFVAVANLAATIAEVKRLGGRVLVAKMSLPGKGKGKESCALLADPDGNVLAVTSAAGTASVVEGGASVLSAASAPPVPPTKAPKTPPAAKPVVEATLKPKAKAKAKR